jgi:uncharacterized repeat protein (TIGR03803 family)
MEILEKRSTSMRRKPAYAAFVLCATTVIALPAQTFTTLLSFDEANGARPTAGLVQATNGDLYGTTDGFLAKREGTVFKITPSGTLTTVYNFCSQSGCMAGKSIWGLVQATNGDFYGTTFEGGAKGDYGTVFKITPSGTLTTLYSFCSLGYPCADGENPLAGLIQAANGDFYGTTGYGGANAGQYCCGTIFKITPSGTLTTLYSFCSQSGCADGDVPGAALVQAINLDFYGTTSAGGANNGGTVFKITPSGMLTTLYTFCSQDPPYCMDGASPSAAMVQATDGDLYGTTHYGGANGYGTVFKITPTGTLTTLHSFDFTDGEYPAGLVQATDGALYGTTYEGGANGDGTVFRITPSGTLTSLYSFCSQSGCTDGYSPNGLVQATNGDFYGTTFYGGTYGCGTVFSLSVGLGPFVETRLTAGTVGEVVEILGTDLTGATSVSFNGTTAVFEVLSPSLITTTVPAGASTGTVQVTTPGGTLSSNVPFRVLP